MIRNEISKRMVPRVAADGAIAAAFRFEPEFIGFQGHFPGKAILPGACQLQCLLALLEHAVGKALALREIVLAKYIAPVFPGEEIVIRLTGPLDAAAAESTVKALVFRGEDKVAELRVRIARCGEV